MHKYTSKKFKVDKVTHECQNAINLRLEVWNPRLPDPDKTVVAVGCQLGMIVLSLPLYLVELLLQSLQVPVKINDTRSLV